MNTTFHLKSLSRNQTTTHKAEAPGSRLEQRCCGPQCRNVHRLPRRFHGISRSCEIGQHGQSQVCCMLTMSPLEIHLAGRAQNGQRPSAWESAGAIPGGAGDNGTRGEEAEAAPATSATIINDETIVALLSERLDTSIRRDASAKVFSVNNELQLIAQASSSIPPPTATFSTTRSFSPNTRRSHSAFPQQGRGCPLKVEGGGDGQLDLEGYDGTDSTLVCCPMSPTALTPIAVSSRSPSFPSRRDVLPSTQLDRAIVLSLLDSSVTTDVLLTGSDHISRH